MSSGEATAPSGGTAVKTGPLPFDTSKAHQARVYDYLLGRKIQVVDANLLRLIGD